VRAIKGAKVAKEASAAERAAAQIAAAQPKNIPVNYTQSITRGSGAPQTRGIPVTSVESTATGTGVPKSVNKTLTNPSVQELENASQQLRSGGYGVKTRVGGTGGRKSVAGGGASIFEPASPQTVVNFQGKKTAIPISEGAESARVIAPKSGANKTRVSFGETKELAPKLPVEPAIPQDSATRELVGAADSTKRSLLGKLSTAATKRGSGIKTDPAVGGIDRADEAARTIQRLGITGTPTQQLRKVNEVMASHGKQVDDVLAKNPIQLDGTAVRAQVEKAVSDPLKYAELDLSTPGAQKALTAHLDKFAQSKTAKEVNDYVKVLNKVATRAKAKLDKGGTLTDKESAALAAKRSGDEVLSQYPEIAPLKKDMATLFERNADITKQSEKTAGIPILGIKSRAISQGVSSTASKIGNATAKADAAITSPTGQGVKKVGGSLLAQLTTRAVGAPLVAGQSPNTPINQNTPEIPSDTTMNPASNATIDPLNPASGQSASSSFFSDPAQVENAYMQAINNGDTETANALIKGYELFGASAGGTAKPLSAEASKVIANANSGIESLDQLAGMIESGGVPKGTLLPGRSLFGGLMGAQAGTTSYDTAAKNVADVITRLRTGAALTESEEKFYKSQLPAAFDPPETVAQKMAMFRDLFSSIANRTGSAGTDLQQLAEAEL
jgi:hypothetical protein